MGYKLFSIHKYKYITSVRIPQEYSRVFHATVFPESENNMENKRRNGYLALCKKYGKGAAVAIIIRAKNDRARRDGNAVLSCAQSKREDWRSIETKAKDIYGKWY
jgi:hypothetical protein